MGFCITIRNLFPKKGGIVKHDAMDQQLNIAIAFDRNYLNPAYAFLASLFSTNPSSNIHLHIIATGLTANEKDGIIQYVESVNAAITFYAIDSALVGQFVLNSTWTAAVYYRLFFPLLVPQDIKRLLYIDSDTLVVGGLTELYHQNLENFPVGAVYDCYVKSQPLIGIEKEGDYFNSGVLLMDLKRWREQEVSARAISYLTTFPERILFVDQCALNAVLKENWMKLPAKYNLLYTYIPEGIGKRALKKLVAESVIIHFTLHRPWSMLGRNRMSYLYYHYLKSSPAGKNAKRFTDFAWKNIPQFLLRKLFYIYLDMPGLPVFWRRIKTYFVNDNR
jgi:lipopolysaccharide biosynthesis glycosyltransferase